MDTRSFQLIIALLLSVLQLSTISAQQNSNEKYIYRVDDKVIISDAERMEGVTYKVEVAKLPSINPNDPELNRLKKYGTLYTETIDNRDLKAILIGTFTNKKDARNVSEQLKSSGFTSAEVITYRNGLRQK